MKIHILGICGTFMGGLAVIARELGHDVSGSDLGIYPPMSDALEAQGITLLSGYEPEHLQPAPDLVIIGNALSRGNAAVEYVLNQKIPYTSGPQWLADSVLRHRHVLAVSGTHGKTTTTAMLTWILELADLNPGYLIGGVAADFSATARLGSDYFVIEADEYDTAFFDKRSKFIHYCPDTLIMNNLEFDHADIFKDLDAIKLQFQYALRGVPSNGLVISNGSDPQVSSVLERGCWSRQVMFDAPAGWHGKQLSDDCSDFEVYFKDEKKGRVNWSMIGQYNMQNGIAAMAAAADCGVSLASSCDALSRFGGIKRRLEVRGVIGGVTIYDDFAHHPTAIEKTLQALRQRVKEQRIIAVLQLGSNSMKQGVHTALLPEALKEADRVMVLEPATIAADGVTCYPSVDAILEDLLPDLTPSDHVLIMSNKSFDGIYDKLLAQLEAASLA